MTFWCCEFTPQKSINASRGGGWICLGGMHSAARWWGAGAGIGRGSARSRGGFFSLGGAICHLGANTLRFLQRLMYSTCRNTLREKYFAWVQLPRFQYFTCRTARFSLCSFSRKFTFGQDRPETQKSRSRFHCSQKHRRTRTGSAAPPVASCAWTPLWHPAGQAQLLQESRSYTLNSALHSPVMKEDGINIPIKTSRRRKRRTGPSSVNSN